MALVILPDVHLGLNVTSNTITASRKLWRETINTIFLQICHDATQAGDKILQVGDLFHKFSNSESTLLVALNGLAFSRNADTFVLAGNHDVVQDSEKLSSLDILASFESEFTECFVSVARAEYGQEKVSIFEADEFVLYAVPHHTTQDLFVAAVERTISLAEKSSGSKPSVLALHCNLFRDEETLKDTELNLTNEDISILASYFDAVFVGHEHRHLRIKDEPVILACGSLYPTTIAEARYDHFYYRWDAATGKLEKIKTFDSSKEYFKENWKALDGFSFDDVKFIELTGTCAASELVDVSRVVKKLWDENPQLLAIRDMVEPESKLVNVNMEVEETGSLADFGSVVASQLDNEFAVEIFKDILSEANNAETS